MADFKRWNRLRSTSRVLERPSIPSEEIYGYCELFSTDWWLISCALFMMIFVQAVGGLAIVGFLACVSAIVWRNPGLTGRSLIKYSPIILLAFIPVASTIWSDAPDITAKQSSELLLSVLCNIIVLRRISGSSFAVALLGPSFILCFLCLAMQPSAFHGIPLQGFIGSKNFFAFLAQLLLASAIAVLLDSQFSARIRIFAIFALSLGIVDVILARSAGAWITSVLFVFTFITLRISEKFSLGVRIGIGVAVMAIMLPVALAHKVIIAAGKTFQAQVLHKDTTLTGRTGLWNFSKSLIAERPMFGHGFAAFWRQGNLDAEALWRQLGIATRSGITFHNQFIDITVDLGYVGLAIFIIVLIWIAGSCLWRAISKPTISSAFFTSLLVALYAKLPVEGVLIGPWDVFTLLWLGVAIHAVSPIVSRTVPHGRKLLGNTRRTGLSANLKARRAEGSMA